MWRPKNWELNYPRKTLENIEANSLEEYTSVVIKSYFEAGADAMQKAMLKHFSDNMKEEVISFLYAHGDVERFKKEVESLFTEL